MWRDCLWYDIFVNCKWVVTRWQLCNTHLHTNNTQNDSKQTIRRTTQTLRIHKFWNSAGRAPTLRDIPWHSPYNWGKSHCCSGRTNIHSVFVVELRVTVNYIKMFSVAALTMLLWQIHVASNNKWYMGLHVKCPKLNWNQENVPLLMASLGVNCCKTDRDDV